MKVFISWSGELSKQIAEVLRDWIPSVLQSVKPFFTPNDIEKGARWASDIASELKSSNVGVFVITPENSQKPWIMFEAGAISRQIENSKICIVLFGLESTDLKGPLTQFQATKFEKIDFKRLIENINDGLGEARLKQNVLDGVFNMWWPDLETKIKDINNSFASGQKSNELRDQKDIIEEILSISRAIHKEMRPPETPRPVPAPTAFRYEGSAYEKMIIAIKGICMDTPFRNDQISIISPIIDHLKKSVAGTRLIDSAKNSIIKELSKISVALENEFDHNEILAPTIDKDDDIPF